MVADIRRGQQDHRPSRAPGCSRVVDRRRPNPARAWSIRQGRVAARRGARARRRRGPPMEAAIRRRRSRRRRGPLEARRVPSTARSRDRKEPARGRRAERMAQRMAQRRQGHETEGPAAVISARRRPPTRVRPRAVADARGPTAEPTAGRMPKPRMVPSISVNPTSAGRATVALEAWAPQERPEERLEERPAGHPAAHPLPGGRVREAPAQPTTAGSSPRIRAEVCAKGGPMGPTRPGLREKRPRDRRHWPGSWRSWNC